MNQNKFESKSDKALYGIYLLSKEGKSPITVEDLAVKLWKLYSTEFCMKGYPDFPNVDIQKYLTKLFTNNLIKGGVIDYKITSKGSKMVEDIIKTSHDKEKRPSESDVTIRKDLVAYCEANKNKDENLKNILGLWKILNKNFGDIIK